MQPALSHAVVDALRECVTAALEGELSSDEVLAIDAKFSGIHPLFAAICGDIEEGVLHTPGHWLSGKVDMATWKRTEEYTWLEVDLVVLSALRKELAQVDALYTYRSSYRLPSSGTHQAMRDAIARDLETLDA